MTLRPLLVLALLSGSACVEGDEPVDGNSDLGDQAQMVTSAQRDFEPVEEADVCDVLPPDGACSHACDHATLSSFVPAGTCAVFHCELLDGREISLHACRPGD